MYSQSEAGCAEVESGYSTKGGAAHGARAALLPGYRPHVRPRGPRDTRRATDKTAAVTKGNEDERLLDVEAGLDDKGSPRSSTSSRRNWLLPVLGGLLCAAYVYSQFAGVAATDPAKPARPQEPFDVILAKAGRRALGGGLSGAAAGIAQVLLLMWLRTAMNYQYRHGQGS